MHYLLHMNKVSPLSFLQHLLPMHIADRSAISATCASDLGQDNEGNLRIRQRLRTCTMSHVILGTFRTDVRLVSYTCAFQVLACTLTAGAEWNASGWECLFLCKRLSGIDHGRFHFWIIDLQEALRNLLRMTSNASALSFLHHLVPMHIANRSATSATLTSDKACANARSHDATCVATRRAPLRNQRHLGQGNLSATSATFASDKACAHARCHMSSWAHPAQMCAWQIHLRLSVMHTDSRRRMEGFWVGKFSSLQALCLQTLSLYAYIEHSRSAFCIIDL